MKTMQLRRPFYLVLALALLVACTGPAATPDASVSISSPANGATITGERSITVTAALEDAAAGATVSAQVNGIEATTTRVGNTVTFPATLQDNANSLSISVQNPGQAAPATATVNVVYPFLTFTDLQPASFAIGQPDLVSDTETADDKAIDLSYGRVAIVNGVLYVPDYGAGRVMGYNSVPAASDASADFVLGKASFADTDVTVSPTTLGGPGSLDTDGERLFVSDYTHNRVLVYAEVPTTDGAPGSYALGQPDLVSDAAACSATGLDQPESVTFAAGRLVVADSGNNRVLIWNSVPQASGVAPDVVLGQATLTTCMANDDDQDGAADATPSPRVMNYPSDAWSDGERLIVADSDNNRILVWYEFPTTDFTPADVVLGQPNFEANTTGVGATGLDFPYFLHSNGNQLFVADSSNSRVLIWDSLPETDGQPADQVLGQANFDANGLNASEASINAAGFAVVTGVAVFGQQLFVADNGNGRILVFDAGSP